LPLLNLLYEGTNHFTVSNHVIASRT
jgi:hypothetical protein